MDDAEPDCDPPPPPHPLDGTLSGTQLVEAPILFFLYFHKALLFELSELRRTISEALDRISSGSSGGELIAEIRRRFEFLNVAYKYHCAAEDEVVFSALDAQVEHVACTYILEHESIDNLFESIANCLSGLIEDAENVLNSLEELLSCVRTIETVISQHMLKEEKQVFPLLIQSCSCKQQTSLVWQFLCSVPMMDLEALLAWLTSFVSPEEQTVIMHCIKEAVPKEEELLQEVLVSWLKKKHQPLCSSLRSETVKEAKCPNCTIKSNDMLKACSSSWNAESSQATIRHGPIDGLHIWHSAISKDMKENLDKLYEMKSSNDFSLLCSVTVELRFYLDITVYYSNALQKVFQPAIDEFCTSCSLISSERFKMGVEFEGLQRLLHLKNNDKMALSTFVEKLCVELEMVLIDLSKNMAYIENEVFPIINQNCNTELQQWLLYRSLLALPLGLLKSMITWFSAHLPEVEANAILNSINQGTILSDNKPFQSLLSDWIRIGYSGKISVDKFRTDLEKLFLSGNSFLKDKIKEDYAFSSPSKTETSIVISKGLCDSSSSNCCAKIKDGITYSSDIYFHVHFPRKSNHLSPFQNSLGAPTSKCNVESRPVDHIIFFHKALKKDLEFLISVSSKLALNSELLVDFQSRFQLIRSLYQVHCDSEDEIAFPALEAKGEAPNISGSYTMDHKLEFEHFNKISLVIDQLSRMQISVHGIDSLDERMIKYRGLCMILNDMSISMHKLLTDHIYREELEIWSLFRECFPIGEQEKIVGNMLGRINAEKLQEMILWLMASLTEEEQHAIMSLWRKATKNTMFDEWLGEWWGVKKINDTDKTDEDSIADPLKVEQELNIFSSSSAAHLSIEDFSDQGYISQKESSFGDDALSVGEGNNCDETNKSLNKDCIDFAGDIDKKIYKEKVKLTSQDVKFVPEQSKEISPQEQPSIKSQGELEAAIRQISRNSALDPKKKSYIIQNLLMSRWVATQKKSLSNIIASSNTEEEVPGQYPSYRDPENLVFGCEHYKRNCKLLASCCNRLYACRRCHDDEADHTMDMKTTLLMMCMKCLIIQPVGPTCSTFSCNNFSMARYFCRICKLFDDLRDIYHCPFCNLCRVGKGLGKDFFHCMNCNACMWRSLSEVHICREKCFEDNCPICHEYLFTSTATVKALRCGHLMHSECFKNYTCNHYTCPICSKSLGDMQVYFGMIDALLAEAKIPDEYSEQTQAILCNDCEKKGTTQFQWFYHKCPYCGSYNTRLL
ncbi:zinc finger protein BRUTUS-like At1g18910 [Impatiens glandulifera]|uniref:zinc finger protein BRUTUS-like At1g18910 n=1 Tax=Impatiens glandulifera TaxID=253017 RepID=UPI001FB0BDA2|nr:zinc finger protein BRUTUS-like At1g18910 [Impatiens glandulifera]